MKSVKILTAAVLSACLLSVPVFAEHAPLPIPLIAQAGVQTTTTPSLDIYVDGALVATGVSTYANIELTLNGRGNHTITVSTSGSTTPVYTGSYASTVTGQVIHLATNGSGNVSLS